MITHENTTGVVALPATGGPKSVVLAREGLVDFASFASFARASSTGSCPFREPCSYGSVDT
jgi:hypothetical protein